MTDCERCGQPSEKLYKFRYKDEDDEDEEITLMICWDCDHDLINGGDVHEDAGDIIMDRWENQYEYDPINVPKPSWLP